MPLFQLHIYSLTAVSSQIMTSKTTFSFSNWEKIKEYFIFFSKFLLFFCKFMMEFLASFDFGGCFVSDFMIFPIFQSVLTCDPRFIPLDYQHRKSPRCRRSCARRRVDLKTWFSWGLEAASRCSTVSDSHWWIPSFLPYSVCSEAELPEDVSRQLWDRKKSWIWRDWGSVRLINEKGQEVSPPAVCSSLPTESCLLLTNSRFIHICI